MTEYKIKTPEKGYMIEIDENLDGLKECLDKISFSGKACIISCDDVWSVHGDLLKNALKDLDVKIFELILDKDFDCTDISAFDRAYTLFTDNSFTRNDFVIAFGGRQICEYAGFAAATFKRGLKLIEIPTSLLSMSMSVGSRAGGCLKAERGNISLIYHPVLVFMDTEFALTLSPADYYSGFADIMRAAIVKSSSVYEWLIDKLYEISERDPQIVRDMVEQTVSLKKIYADKDIKGVNESLLYDLGAYTADAIYETEPDRTYGEALALGTIVNAYISMKKEMLSLEEYLEIRDMFVPFNLPITIDKKDTDALLKKIRKNAQIAGNGFVLLKKIGKAVICEVSDEEIKAALDEISFSDDDFVVE